jgi:hypothetical protein
MTARRSPTPHAIIAACVAAALAGTLSLAAREAHAYTFVEELSDDPCERARAFEPQDATLTAQKARRACRLAVFERRMADERRQAAVAEQQTREAWLQKWAVTTQPARVLNPMAVEVFGGSGIANYGLVFSWTVLRQLEIAARVGQRQMTCAANSFSGSGGDCTRTTWNGGLRYFLGDRDFTPFVGAAFSTTSASLAILKVDQMNGGGTTFLQGNGRANSVSASGGLQLAYSYLRLSLEYIFEYVFYTGANLSDMQKTPSEDLRLVWADSLRQDRHGVRFQVGFAF